MTTTRQGTRQDAGDFTTSEGLRALLTELERDGGRGWRTNPAATALLLYAATKYLPIARTWHRDPDEVLSEAFLAMRSPSAHTATDPWAVITRAVELGVAAEVHGERLLTSADKARRPEHRPQEQPVRAGDYEEFFYHVLTAPTSSPTTPVSVERVVRSASVFLVMTGWNPKLIEPAVEYICQRLTSLANTQSGLDVLRKDQAARLRLGFGPSEWTGLLRLLLGPRTKKPVDGEDWSRLGIFARLLLGDTTDDLYADAQLRATSTTLAGARS